MLVDKPSKSLVGVCLITEMNNREKEEDDGGLWFFLLAELTADSAWKILNVEAVVIVIDH